MTRFSHYTWLFPCEYHSTSVLRLAISLSVSFHQCPILGYFPVSIIPPVSYTWLFPCQYHTTSVLYLAISLSVSFHQCPILGYFPVSIIPPVSYTHPHLQCTVNRRIHSLETFRKALSVIGEHRIWKYGSTATCLKPRC